MTIKNHILQGVEYDPAQRIKGVITPIAIVQHYTAGYNLASPRHIFKTTAIAAHLTIDRDGTVLQMVPFNRGCNHAGPSKFKELSMLNNSSIGIEHVNIGFLKKIGSKFVDAYGGTYKGDTSILIPAKHPRVGSETYYWEPYTDIQLKKSLEITAELLDTYSTIKYIVSHEEIDTRGWKTDPGVAFPMDKFKALLHNDKGPRVTTPDKNTNRQVKSTVAGLNVRSGPGANYDLATNFPLYEGQVVDLISVQNGWAKVLINGAAEGYVSAKYITES